MKKAELLEGLLQTPCTGFCADTAQGFPVSDDLSALPPQACRVIMELTLLLEVSEALQESPQLDRTIQPMLQKLAKHLGLSQGFITIFNRENGDQRIDESFGLPTELIHSIRYQPGEGVIGRAMETRQPAFVTDIHRNPEFLNRTGILSAIPEDGTLHTGFLSVPIHVDQQIVGTINVFRRAEASSVKALIEADTRLLTLIATQIAQAVHLRQDAWSEMESLRTRNQELLGRLEGVERPASVIGNSNVMQQVFFEVQQVALSATTVLIRGESGTGKELIARAIHDASTRVEEPFVAVNCAALPESLVESELFGHERGAFTGATQRRKGRFQQADGGTLFLDEIGELTASAQGKLLRVLQEGTIDPVGSEGSTKVDVRVVTATNRPLEEMVAEGSFRQDLFYRLNIFPIFIPPLRERKSDILPLADFFVEKCSERLGKRLARISTPAIDMLMSYHWPGNVRELENVIERAALLCRDGVIHGYHLPATLQTGSSTQTALEEQPLQSAMDAFEREIIIESLKSNAGNMAAASRKLGLTERQMGLRVKKYNIDTSLFKGNSG